MNSKIKDMLYCSLFAGIVAILAQFQIPIGIVPVTLQTLGIYLIGTLLKPKLALISALVYVIMGAISLPVFSGFNGGFSSVLGPSGGFIISFPVMAWTISLLVNHNDKLIIKIIALLLATTICYIIGTIWFIYVTKAALAAALSMCVLPFIPGDIIKIIIAVILSNKLANKFNSN